MPAAAAAVLQQRLTEIFQCELDSPLRDDEFNALARDLFAFQFQHNAPFAAYCARRGRTPDQVSHWTQIPPVPTAAFKEAALVAGRPQDALLRFRTSGTTRGRERRGVHYMIDPTIYQAALLPLFEGYLLPDDAALAFVSLIPDAAQLTDSSLSYMASCVARRYARLNAGSFMDAQLGLQQSALERTLFECIDRTLPVLLLGTSLAFQHWLESLAARNLHIPLPEGSRLMDTGGFKGRTRTVPEPELRQAYTYWLDIPEYACINEYGMTELCSQFYDSTLRDHALGRTPPAKRSKPLPPWVRTRAVHPETLEPLAEGEVGILQHFDLANLYSVLAVQTEDLGRVSIEGMELLGRVPGALPRGCSIALDLLIEANRS
jgi:hypothetical protein